MADDKQEKPPELKPCPSNCGRTVSPFKLRSGLAEGLTIILCECGWRTSVFTDPAHAAEMWNTRAPAPAEQAERLAGAVELSERNELAERTARELYPHTHDAACPPECNHHKEIRESTAAIIAKHLESQPAQPRAIWEEAISIVRTTPILSDDIHELPQGGTITEIQIPFTAAGFKEAAIAALEAARDAAPG